MLAWRVVSHWSWKGPNILPQRVRMMLLSENGGLCSEAAESSSRQSLTYWNAWNLGPWEVVG